MEFEAHYQWQYLPETLALFDIHAAYKMDSDVPTPYIVKLLEELMACIDIHSYGKAHRNRLLKRDDGGRTKLQTTATYKFSLAFEYAVGKDYVTEKFSHPLMMGSVPVYLGAPNIADFAPGEHCYIDVRDFSSARALADHLLKLDKDDNAFRAYLGWKKRPFRPAFEEKLRLVSRSPLMRLYDLLETRFPL